MPRCFGGFQLDGIEGRYPTREFEKQLTLQIGDTLVELIDLGPAHTDSDVVVHVPSAKLVFTGDILFIGGHPIMWSGPVDNWLRACERILAMDVDWVVPGHGPITGKRGVQAMHSYFSLVAERSRALYAQGAPREAAAREIARDIEGTGYSTWIDAERLVVTVGCIYRDLANDSTLPAPGAAFAEMAAFSDELALHRA
jgi:glyoxylase-like metal-dependent hydrolase (beta-lactamase superfamily II)